MARQTPRPSAYQWLWAEIERRYGADAAAELKSGYLEQNKIACRMKWHSPESPWQPRAKPPPKRGK